MMRLLKPFIDRFGIRPVKFAMVGGIGTLLGLLIFWTFNEVFLMFYMISAALTDEITILWNFTLNQLWTFRDRRMFVSKIWHRLVKYQAVAFTGMAINLAVIFTLVQLFMINKYVSYICAVIIVFFWNYTFSNRWAWKAETG